MIATRSKKNYLQLQHLKFFKNIVDEENKRKFETVDMNDEEASEKSYTNFHLVRRLKIN